MVAAIRKISPIGGMMIVLMMVLVLTGVGLTLTNLSSLNIRTIVSQMNQTANTTNEILNSSTRFAEIIGEIRETQNEIRETEEVAEESRQNQTTRLLPIFFKSFNQTEQINDVVQNLTEILAERRFIEKQIRDVQNRIEFDLSRQINVTNSIAENLAQGVGRQDEIVGLLQNISRQVS